MTQGCPKRGIVPPVATPLTVAGDLDRAALRHLCERMIRAGVDGLFVLGTTGEAPSLGYGMRRAIIEEVCSVSGGRVPVLVGVTDTSLEEAVSLTQHARQYGAAATVVAPPYYFPISQDELESYVRLLVEASPLPVYLYNFPGMTKVRFEIETLKRLGRLPNVAGLKDSSGDMDYFRAALAAVSDFEDFAIFMGPEEQLSEALHLGATGGVTGGANLFPELYVGLYRAVTEGRVDEERALQERLMTLSRKIYGIGGYGSSFLKGLKASMWLCGLCENILAPPHLPLDAAGCESVRERLEEMGLLTAQGEPALHL